TLTLNQVNLGGAGTLTNAGSLNLNLSQVNVAVNNEAGVLTVTGSDINNGAAQPFVNGPDATLRLPGENLVQFANGFTNEGRIELQTVARRQTTLGVSSGTLVNAPQGVIQLAGSSNTETVLNADFDNEGLLTAGNVLFSQPSGTLINNGTMRVVF